MCTQMDLGINRSHFLFERLQRDETGEHNQRGAGRYPREPGLALLRTSSQPSAGVPLAAYGRADRLQGTGDCCHTAGRLGEAAG